MLYGRDCTWLALLSFWSIDMHAQTDYWCTALRHGMTKEDRSILTAFHFTWVWGCPQMSSKLLRFRPLHHLSHLPALQWEVPFTVYACSLHEGNHLTTWICGKYPKCSPQCLYSYAWWAYSHSKWSFQFHGTLIASCEFHKHFLIALLASGHRGRIPHFPPIVSGLEEHVNSTTNQRACRRSSDEGWSLVKYSCNRRELH